MIKNYYIKKIFKKSFKKPFIILFLGLVLFIFKNNYAFGGILGDLFNINSILAGAIGWAAFGVSYIISIIAGAFIALESFLIVIILQINTQILKSDFVQSGFSISLAVANLFFVGMVIFVAIATILRRETYGIKAMLAKLILMAVLINFGLTIAGAIIQLADSFSLYFIQSTNPGGEYADFNSFATAIAGAFTPQRFFMFKVGGHTLEELKGKSDKDLSGLIGSNLSNIIKPIVGLFFSIVILMIIIITFGALIVMLLYRYVALGILLILLPLAWVSWVFPNLRRHWDEWWNTFFRWTFFAPLVLFFIYLCLLTLRGSIGGGGVSGQGEAVNVNFGGLQFQYNPSSKNEVISGLAAFGGSFIGELIIPLLNGIIMTSCFLGGLFASNKLGIEGSKTAYNRAVNTAKSVGNWAKNRAKGYVASTMTRAEPPEYTGWRRIFNPINRLTYGVGRRVGGVAERFGAGPALEETALKYGPLGREVKRRKIKELKEGKINEKGEVEEEGIKQINEKIANPQIIAQQRAQLEQVVNNLKNELNQRKQSIQNTIRALESALETEPDLKKRDELQEQINKEKSNLQAIQDDFGQKIREAENRLDTFNKENNIEALLSRRRALYKEISELEPKGLFKTITDSALGREESKKKKQEKAFKEFVEAFGIKTEEEKKEEKKSQPPPPPQPKPPPKQTA